MNRPLFSICHSTARPDGWRVSYDLWMSRAAHPEDVEYVLCIDERWGFNDNDESALGRVADYTLQRDSNMLVWNTGRKCMVDGVAAACKASTGQVLIVNSDDMEPPQDWDVLLAAQFASLDPCSAEFVLHVSTGWCDGPQACGIQIVSRARFERLGYVLYPEYESLYSDDDFLQHAYHDGCVIDARHITIKHNHTAEEGSWDAVYKHQNSHSSAALGRNLLTRRKAAGFVSMDAKAILFCPVRERPETFEHALDAHRKLRGVAERWYFDDNGEQFRSLEFLPSERLLEVANLPERTEYKDHGWTDGSISRITAIKDAAIQEFLKTDAQFLFLIDADVVVHPDLVCHLVSLNLPVVCEVYWSQWKDRSTPGAYYPYLPNVWDRHQTNYNSSDSIVQLRTPGQYAVGGMGACTLIRRDVLEKNVCFAPVAGLDYWGEDRHFCTRAAVAGFSLVADTVFPPFHVYRESQFAEMVAWREAGSKAEYFAEEWLGARWETSVRDLFAPIPKPRSIACCFPGESFSRVAKCYWSALEAHMIHRGFRVVPFYAEMSSPDSVREALRRQVLDSPVAFDYALWIDDDQLLSTAQFEEMLNDIESLPPRSMVAAWSHCDSADGPVISAGWQDKRLTFSELMTAKGLIQVDWSGFPAVLMSVDLLEAAGECPFAPIPNPKSQWGHTFEDVSFCVNATARAGAKVFIDPKIFVPHLKLKALGLDGSPKSIEQACNEATALLLGQVEVRTKPKQEQNVA